MREKVLGALPCPVQNAQASPCRSLSPFRRTRGFDRRSRTSGYHFADLMEHAYRDGQPSALAAFEATGGPIWHLHGCIQGTISRCSKVVFPLIALRNSHASQRAQRMDRAAQELCHNMPEDRRPASMFSAHIWAMSHGVSNCSHVIPQARKARLPPRIY